MFNSVKRKEYTRAEKESKDILTNEHNTGPQNTFLKPSCPIPKRRGKKRVNDTAHFNGTLPGMPSHEAGSSDESSIALTVGSSQHQHNPSHQIYMKKQRMVSNSKNALDTNPNTVRGNPISSFRHVEMKVSIIEPITSFKAGGFSNEDQVGTGGLDLFLESPGTSSVEPRASPIFLMPRLRLRLSSSDLFS